ncbi:Oidioi.mRNA.OKI2018_I69.XSR.g15230.t1.cds [Oikopleura dioica]|uniref:Oidioi.mRNA.OKI2018_I69.XSR.g15230.t1.cds n=1 Tax=Oikopleura dioica TaxID=34765 RepID=A0ABN7SC66_OIKDI|nr:Oidioi.mRNA.OKI2018_I69.XSR.g15230.t1.cds [Oikopleura dioica]
MLSKRSLALTSICYNLCAILATLLVDIIAPGPFASCLPVRPVADNGYVGFILTRAVLSSAKHRPSYLINSATREGQQFVLQSVYGSRNIAWPWFIRYATDYSYNWPIWHVLHLYDYGQRIVFMSFLLNLLLTAGAVAAFAGVSRRALHSVVVADLSTVLFFLATPLWTIDPLSPFPLASFLAIFGFYLYEGGSAQFAGAFLISISAICPGAFMHGTCAILSFAKNVLNFITSTWSDFWKRSWSSRVFVALPKATIYVYWILFQSGMALIGYGTFSVIFFFLNRVGRTDNMVGDSTYNFKSLNGRAAKLTEYAKLPIQYLTVSQFGKAETITDHHSLWSKVYRNLLFLVLCPLIVSVGKIFLGSFRATIKRKSKLVYAFRRPEKRFWRFIPHALIFFGTVLHTLSHRHCYGLKYLGYSCAL